MKYLASKKLGIGTLESQDDKFYTVFWEESERTTKVLISLGVLFDTYEEAESSLEEKEEEVYERPVFDSKHQQAMEEMKEKAFYAQRPSSMR